VALKERYRLTPTELRKVKTGNPANEPSDFCFRLSYRPPFDWERTLDFLGRRAIPAVELAHDGAYLRTVQVSRHGREYSGIVKVGHEPATHALSVRLSDELVPVCAVVLERVKCLFDLHADPTAHNKVLGSLSDGRPGLRVPGSFDGFEMAVRAILGQHISVAAARTLAGRLVVRFGLPLPSSTPSLAFHFPRPSRLAGAAVGEIGRLGITAKRGESIIALAQSINRGELVLEPGRRIEGTMKQLLKIPGVGEWTAQYIAMRALSWPDAFPHTDLGIRKALGEKNPRKVLELIEKWRPWRAYAALHLWATLEKKL
jgi:AraC family transcriptional regulator of adaptative response / DNA-3-methyladenine glycosylase II